jgi:hypothetical protein
MASPTIHHPGYELAHSFSLEIADTTREKLDTITLSLNSFTLPEFTNQSFDVYFGPGFPPMRFPGIHAYGDFELDLTNFYERKTVEYFAAWYEGALYDIVHYLRNGFVLGFDDNRQPVYKANVFDMWPSRYAEGRYERSTDRQQISVTLFVREIVYDPGFNAYEFTETPLS